MNIEDLSSEMQDKVKACKTAEELLELAKTEGYDLSDEDLEAIAGGGSWDDSCDDWDCRNLSYL